MNRSTATSLRSRRGNRGPRWAWSTPPPKPRSPPPAVQLSHPPGLPRAIEAITAALSAELVGGMQRVLDLAVEYAKTRKQFGKPIGQFQAVQHQLADSYLETESARSAAYYAALALDTATPD